MEDGGEDEELTLTVEPADVSDEVQTDGIPVILLRKTL